MATCACLGRCVEIASDSDSDNDVIAEIMNYSSLKFILVLI